MMKKIILLLGFLFAASLNAATSNITIDERKNDIYFLNGKLVTRDGAWEASDFIYNATKADIYKGNTSAMEMETNFDILYNQTFGFYADVLEAFNQKKAEHKYFWITIDAISFPSLRQ
jgi:hypothetical protein